MKSGLQKILDLIKKTGDRVIVLDSESQTPFAILPFEEYERLIKKDLEWLEDLEDDWENPLAQASDKQPPLPWEEKKEDFFSPPFEAREEDNWQEDEDGDEEDDFFYPSRKEMGEPVPIADILQEKEEIPEDHYYFEPVES